MAKNHFCQNWQIYPDPRPGSPLTNTDIESLCSHPINKVHSLVQNHTHCITVPHVQVAIKN